ncbi:MAG: hypothetical protein A2Y80_02155 [Deltaproteobacteria bacterium RBG_13_58_19]|nr:MAG: hypothetical protein A2Y80_02155 [Deltaproteobacteria bacterium RBG_13_58_19]
MLLKIIDQATELAKKRLEAANKAYAGGIVAAGYELRAAVKRGIQQQAPGGESWPEPSPWIQFGPSLLARARQQQHRLEKRKRATRKPPPPLFGSKGRTALKKLAGAVRLEKSGDIQEIRVKTGFLNPRVAKLAAYHASGPHQLTVTEKMRRLIFGVGLGISKKTIIIPKREHVAPVYRRNEKIIAPFVRARVNAALAGKEPKAIRASFR